MENDSTKPTSFDEYIAGYPADVQTVLQQIRETIRQAAPEATEVFSYGIPGFKLHGNLLHFAAYPHHIGLYPTPAGDEAFQQEIAGMRAGKSTVRLPMDRPIPYDLIARITRFRVQENMERAARKR
jgi:uncharacterized protein YdhG (YjbR/CyaY superfamily)